MAANSNRMLTRTLYRALLRGGRQVFPLVPAPFRHANRASNGVCGVQDMRPPIFVLKIAKK